MADFVCDFPLSGYSIDAIQRAAYKFTDRFAIEITRECDYLSCQLDFEPGIPNVDEVVRLFKTEALDQTLRERIRSETEGVRNLILAVAFSQVALDDSSSG